MKVCAAQDVAVGEAKQVVVGDVEIAVVNLGEEGFRAIGDVCSHAQAYLSEGEVEVEDATIECPLHGSTFDLESGDPRTLPATRPVPVYPAKREGDDILIEVNP